MTDKCPVCDKPYNPRTEIKKGVKITLDDICSPKCQNIFDEVFYDMPEPKVCFNCGVKITKKNHGGVAHTSLIRLIHWL